jgi:hypothetical protein
MSKFYKNNSNRFVLVAIRFQFKLKNLVFVFIAIKKAQTNFALKIAKKIME